MFLERAERMLIALGQLLQTQENAFYFFPIRFDEQISQGVKIFDGAGRELN